MKNVLKPATDAVRDTTRTQDIKGEEYMKEVAKVTHEKNVRLIQLNA